MQFASVYQWQNKCDFYNYYNSGESNKSRPPGGAAVIANQSWQQTLIANYENI